jgi:hypothetical protein
MLGYQVTYKQTDHDCNKGTTHSDTLHFPSVATMALRRNVLQEDDILCELYADTRSNVCDSNDNEILDSDSEVSATSSRKQLRSSVVVVTSDSETSTREEESSEPEN